MKSSLAVAWCATAIGAASLLPAAVPPAHARPSAPAVHAGDRVRLVVSGLAAPAGALSPGPQAGGAPASGPLLVGRLTRIETDTVTVQPDSAGTGLAVPVTAIQRLEVWRTANRKTAGGIIGLVAGAAIGAAVGNSLESSDAEQCPEGEFVCLDDMNFISDTAAGLILGSLFGGTFGALIGMTLEYERWETVDVRRLQAGVRLTDRGGVLLSLSFRF